MYPLTSNPYAVDTRDEGHQDLKANVDELVGKREQQENARLDYDSNKHNRSTLQSWKGFTHHNTLSPTMKVRPCLFSN